MSDSPSLTLLSFVNFREPPQALSLCFHHLSSYIIPLAHLYNPHISPNHPVFKPNHAIVRPEKHRVLRFLRSSRMRPWGRTLVLGQP